MSSNSGPKEISVHPRFISFTESVPYTRSEGFDELDRGSGLEHFPPTCIESKLPPRLESGSLSTGHDLGQNQHVLEQKIYGPKEITKLLLSLIDQTEEMCLQLTRSDPSDMEDTPSSTMEMFNNAFDKCNEQIDIDVGRLLRYVLYSCESSDIQQGLVERLGVDLLSTRDILGRYPCVYAIMMRFLSTTALHFLDKTLGMTTLKQQLNTQDVYGNTALDYALTTGDYSDPVLYCLTRGSDLETLKKDKAFTSDDGPGFVKLLVSLYAHLQQQLHFPLYLSIYSEDELVRFRDERSMTFKEFTMSPRTEGTENLTKWIHVHITSGPLIYSIVCRMHLDDRHSGMSGYHSFFIYESFRKLSIMPRDTYLSYRVPGLLRGGSLHARIRPNWVSLVLQTIGRFRSSREHFLKQRKRMDTAWEDAGQYFHTPRTLDEAHYPSLTRNVLESRNQSQVVTREFRKMMDEKHGSTGTAPLLMVSQLWIWLMGSWVVSAYTPVGLDAGIVSRQDGTHKHDGFGAPGKGDFRQRGALSPAWNVAQQLLDQVARFGREECADVYFEPDGKPLHRNSNKQVSFQSPLNYFDNGVVRILADVGMYVERRDFDVDDSNLEMDFMSDIADIREELAMVDSILVQQAMVLDSFSIYVEETQSERGQSDEQQSNTLSSLKEAKVLIKEYRERVSRIDRDAERVDKTVQDRLNVKRTFATMNDAKSSLLLAIAVIGFTVVTILFAPLAFMTALFALNIDGLKRHKLGEGDEAYYPSWYIVATFCKLSLQAEIVIGRAGVQGRNADIHGSYLVGAEVGTIIFTAMIVGLFLRKKQKLTRWADKIAEKTNDSGSTAASVESSNSSAAIADGPSKNLCGLLKRRPFSSDSAKVLEQGQAGHQNVIPIDRPPA